MATLSRSAVLNALQDDWANYVQRFRALSPAAQSGFLTRQGYARLADLLSHLIAWWEAGYHTIDCCLADPGFAPPAYDVDAFNAAAVAKVSGLDDQSLVASFEKMRNFMLDYVKALPDSAFENEKVVRQFDMEFIGHLSEHSIPENE